MLQYMAETLPSPVTAERPYFAPFRPISFLSRRLRGPFLGLVSLGALAALTLLLNLHYPSSYISNDLFFLQDLPIALKPEVDWYPPRFYEWHDKEKQLPQHDPDLPYPQGREGRYVRFSNQVWGALSTVLQLSRLHDQAKTYIRPRMGQRDAGIAVECPPCIRCQTNVRPSITIIFVSCPRALTHYLTRSFFFDPPSYVFENYTWDKTVSGDFSNYKGKRIPARVPLTALLSGARRLCALIR
jgi:hypothetical protein